MHTSFITQLVSRLYVISRIAHIATDVSPLARQLWAKQSAQRAALSCNDALLSSVDTPSSILFFSRPYMAEKLWYENLRPCAIAQLTSSTICQMRAFTAPLLLRMLYLWRDVMAVKNLYVFLIYNVSIHNAAAAPRGKSLSLQLPGKLSSPYVTSPLRTA